MSDRIRVNLETMSDLFDQIKRLSTVLDALESNIRSVQIDRSSGADLRINLPSRTISSINRGLRSGNADDCLRDIAAAASAIQRTTDRFAKNVNRAADIFEQNEYVQIGLYEALNSEASIFNGICQALGFNPDSSTWTPQMHNEYQNLLANSEVVVDGGLTLITADGKGFIFGKHGLIASFEEENSFTTSKQTFKLYTENNGRVELKNELGLKIGTGKIDLKDLKIEPDDLISIQEAYDKDGNPTKKPQSGLAVGILSVGGSTGVSASAWKQEGKYDGEKFDASGSVSVGNGEIHANGQAGFGVYLPNEDGELELYFGGSGEIGASVSVAQAEGSLEYELCDFIEVGAEGEVSVLEAEGKMKGKIGIVGGELAAYGELSAEATLAKAEGNVNLNIAGIEGKAGGSLSFGLGAHAKGGYQDGVLSLDVGVQFGPGVSAYVELDVGEAVDNFVEGGKKVVNALSDVISEFAWW